MERSRAMDIQTSYGIGTAFRHHSIEGGSPVPAFPAGRGAAVKAAALRLAASLAGLPVETVALILTVGLVLGTFPVMGLPTVLCVLAAFGLRLNVAALQLVNH